MKAPFNYLHFGTHCLAPDKDIFMEPPLDNQHGKTYDNYTLQGNYCLDVAMADSRLKMIIISEHSKGFASIQCLTSLL